MEQIIRIAIPFSINIIRYFLIAGFAFLIFYKFFGADFKKNKIQERVAKNQDFIREILHSVQANIIIAAIGIVLIVTPLSEYTLIYRDLAAYPIWWIPISTVIALVIHDTYFYWMHRTIHHPRLFRLIHLEHHKSTNPSPWASYSFHALESVLEAMILPILLIMLPLHPISILLFSTLSFIMNVYGHLGFEIAPKWFRTSFLFEVMNTSVHHNVHHEKFNGNYGLYFRVWDRIMNTEHPEYVKEYDKIQEKRFGINLNHQLAQIKVE